MAVMKSKLAEASKGSLVAQSRRLTPAQRLEAFLIHSRLMVDLQRSGKERRGHLPRQRS
jgi:hypothetical protein